MTNRLPWLKENEPAVAVVPAGFMMCPLPILALCNGGVCPWEAIYAEARQRAERVVRPSPLERLFRVSSN